MQLAQQQAAIADALASIGQARRSSLKRGKIVRT